AEGVGDALLISLAAFGERLARERLRAFDEDRFVERDERLQWRVRTLTANAGGIAVRHVEGLQFRKRRRAAAKDINAPAIFFRACVVLPRKWRVARGRIK